MSLEQIAPFLMRLPDSALPIAALPTLLSHIRAVRIGREEFEAVCHRFGHMSEPAVGGAGGAAGGRVGAASSGTSSRLFSFFSLKS
jgi:hypothetical protein